MTGHFDPFRESTWGPDHHGVGAKRMRLFTTTIRLRLCRASGLSSSVYITDDVTIDSCDFGCFRPGDYVLATNETHSVREFVEKAFQCVDVEIQWQGTGVNEVSDLDRCNWIRANRRSFIRSLSVSKRQLFS